MFRPELLAPARNKDIAIAAINHGADAVYIGGSRFGAREAAGNSMTDIEAVVRHAHRYHAKVYLTMNTILYESELEEARLTAIAAYEAGCDALIVQDMAFLEMDLPPIALHASTQAHNHSVEKVRFLQDVGIQRVVLARELSVAEVEHIHRHTQVELEYFVHGALCVSYSGQCYLSQQLTGRSANRGACAQPCRSAYNLYDARGERLASNKHLLSLKDLNLSHSLEALARAGVSSLKIEGRLKDIDYVKNIVGHYRRTLDSLPYFEGMRPASSGKVQLGFEPSPAKTFSRGYTPYFAQGGVAGQASHHTPKALGEVIGRIARIEQHTLVLQGVDGQPLPKVNNGDGICFYDSRGVLQGTNVNGVQGTRLQVQHTKGAVEKGLVYRNVDTAFQRLLAASTTRRTIDAHIRFEATGQGVRLQAADQDGIQHTLEEHYATEPANNPGKQRNTIEEQLGKGGDTIFSITKVEVLGDTLGFYHIAQLNAWRRSLLAGLEQARLDAHHIARHRIEPNSMPYPQPNVDYRANVLNSLARQFYQRHGAQEVQMAYEHQPVAGAALMTTRYCMLRELGWCKQEKGSPRLHEPLVLENNGQRWRLRFDCKQCQMQVLGEE